MGSTPTTSVPRFEARAFAADATVCAAIVAVVYGRTIFFDFIQDDYHLLRPWSAAELASVFHGPWDPRGWEPFFYRPLTTVWYAAMFWLFGLNATAIHVVSLVIVTVLALLVRSVVLRETGSRALGLLGGAMLLVHPTIAASSVAWITSQHVFLGMICAVAAIRVWQWCRSSLDWRWLALIPPIAAGMMLREDVVMVAPALLVSQYARARLVGDVPSPGWRLIGAMASVLALAFLLRYWLLGGVGGYGFIVLEQLPRIWSRGPLRVLLRPVIGTPGAMASAAIASVLFALGTAAVWRGGRPVWKSLWTLGIGSVFCVNLPLFQFGGTMRYGLMATMACFTLTACAAALVHWMRARGRAVVVVAGAALLATLAFTSRYAYNDRWPCNSQHFEVEMAAEPVTTPDIRAFLLDLPRRCASGSYIRLNDSAPALAWGLAPPGSDGVRLMNEPSATWLVASTIDTVTLRIRAGGPVPDGLSAVLRADTGQEVEVPVRGGDWREVTLRLEPTWLTRLRARHRLDLRLNGHTGRAAPVELALSVR